MKQKLTLSIIFLLSFFFCKSSFASCNNVMYTINQAGNTVTFSASVPAGYVINTYYWTFGDGGNSNAASPVHTYSNFGWYNACMVVSGVDANNQVFQCSYCDSIYIPNNAPCNANFVYTTSGLTASFTNNATGPGVITNYAWNFGDGNQSNLPNPVHTYAANGTYNACLTIYGVNNGLTYTCTWCDSVTVGPNNQPCNPSFIYTTSGLMASFTNTATGPGVITSYAWTFGDGGTSALPNPSHLYASSGWYNVCLTITGFDNNVAYTCTGCDSVYVQGIGGNPCNGVSYTTSQLGNAVTFNAVVPAGYVINTYYWTFGDGGISNAASPTHTYANGSYNACMVISGTTPNNVSFQCTYCDSIIIGNNAPCNASFISTTSGLTAAFTNTATGPGVITNYDWTFGDGATSALPNPTHTYANTGWYNVCLTITGIDNGLIYSCTWCDSIFVLGPGGNPCNGVSYATSQVGNTVTFNAVVPAGYVINTYYWTFGDGGNSNAANPTHTYANNGWYNACMVISGYVNNTPFQCTYCDSIYIANNAPCNASFISTTSGLTAAFTNTATGPGVITNYNWTFGDGGTSVLPNPTHTYATTGWYNVCLTITGIDNGLTYSCTWCDSIYVQGPIGNPCNGVSFGTTQVGNTVTFNAIVPAGYVINTYYWTFGDGGNSNAANPTHTYANNGWYNACMFISGTTPNNVVFQCTYCDSIFIANNAPCNASFTTATAGNMVTFTNTATGPGVITGYNWTFGDGGTSVLPNPVHTYANSGWYNACLTITGINNGVTYTCTWCDSIFIQGAANPCNGVYFNSVLSGYSAAFNVVVPAGYTINTYYWTFGDGGNSNLAAPTHTYTNNGFYNVCVVISGFANNTPFQCMICDSIQVFVSGVNDVDEKNTLHVYPNPAGDYLEIDIPSGDKFILRLFDVAGKLLAEKSMKNSAATYRLNTAGLSKGMYFIQLIADNKKYQTNFVKQQ